MPRYHFFIILSAIFTALTATAKPHYAGLVKIAAANMRATPSHTSELVSQAVMGTPLRLLGNKGNWYLIETPDGYRGYMISNSIQPLDSVAMETWKHSPRIMFTDVYTGRIMSADGAGTPVSDIHSGSVLEVTGGTIMDSLDVILPDGRKGRLAGKSVMPLECMGRITPDTCAIVRMARALMGVSYLWGGTTPAAMDCSGLSKICYMNQGIVLMRDASQQFMTGTKLGTDYRNYAMGDLVFFKSATTGGIVHVGIYDHDGLYIHSSGHVKVNSLNPESPQYIPSNIPAGAIRVTPGAKGISIIAEHPFYFPKQETVLKISIEN